MPAFHQANNSKGYKTYNCYFYRDINYNPHFHRSYEMIFVIEGEILCTVGNRTKLVTQGEFAICLPNETHSLRTLTSSYIWIGVFSEDFIHEFNKLQSGKRGVDFSFRCSDEITSYLKNNLIKESLDDTFLTMSCLYSLCSEYTRQVKLEEIDSKQSDIADAIVKYVSENYKKPLTLAMLAQELGYDYYYFSKLFNTIFKIGFNEYLNNCRCIEASALLKKTELSVTEIAYESGFQSIRSFNNAFKRFTMITPSEFRKVLGEDLQNNGLPLGVINGKTIDR